MFIKVLYVVLVLCTLALIGAVVAAYIKVRRHMRTPGKPMTGTEDNTEQEKQTGTRTGD